ncbi:putative FAD-dependent small molecule halogenase [Lyophyllum shimeji]|uniref:FAD-dependent small molecule halogenase n=1 Tax=Lyophyllum shimeji TaxID=47721 RepID=A0A9P3PTU2_LYOSH|nr:putative FAD-dependent small molecule halogenase [Lyophyllum shimeji]
MKVGANTRSTRNQARNCIVRYILMRRGWCRDCEFSVSLPMGQLELEDTAVPANTTVLVIGGGPAGSYAATTLAREGFDVTLLERDRFPRYHIGESMLPSCRHFMTFIGAESLMKNHGFIVKPGAAVKLRQEKREGYTDFIELDPENIAWNVIRSEFDELLLRHASACGVKVFEGLNVTELKFCGERPTSAVYDAPGGKSRSISFEYLVDASGRTGIMSTKYLRNRRFNKSLRNMAFWGYWKGGGRYSPGTKRENAPWFEAFADESGWAWYIPLHNGTTSVGVIISKESYTAKKAKLAANNADDLNKALYLEQLKYAPGLLRLLGQAKLTTEIKSAGDYSYSASQYAGPHYRIAGDAGAFIDPFFSSGVHLAFTGGLSAASTIAASIRGQCTEAEAAAFHNTKVGVSYTRFLVVVLGIYKQIRAQQEDVLSDVDADNFDKAFDLLRPVIQGNADVDPELTKEELEETIYFCKNILAPTTPEMHKDVAKRMPELASPDGPILRIGTVAGIAGDDEDAKNVLLEVNARKAIHIMYGKGHFGSEVLEGFYVNLERGKLGLAWLGWSLNQSPPRLRWSNRFSDGITASRSSLLCCGRIWHTARRLTLAISDQSSHDFGCAHAALCTQP